MSNRIVLIFLFSFLLHGLLIAQDSTFIYSIDLRGSISSNNQTPFWLRANSNGSTPDEGSFLSGSWGIHKIYHPHNPRFVKWAAGINLVTNLTRKTDVFFTDLYGAVLVGPVELSVGNRPTIMGLGDSTLSMGSVAMSQNFRPYPKIELSTPHYINLIPGHDFLSFKFNYSDGLLGGAAVAYGRVDYVPNIYMHQKSLYIKLGGRNNTLNLYGGFNHQAIWGGENKIFTGGLDPWLAYKYVVIGKPWAYSRVGNHFGSIDLGMIVKGKKWNFFMYRQSIYEDGSLANLSNIADGLNGLRISRKHQNSNKNTFEVKSLLLEFLYTKNQGGSVFDFDKGIFGRDNYFNHYVYPQGWSYRGRGLGTPMIDSKRYLDSNLASSNSDFTNNNRIAAVHLGLAGSLRRIDFTLKSTFSQNEGTFGTTFEEKIYQTSLFLKVDHKLGAKAKSKLTFSFAGDFGKLYSQNRAFTIGFTRSGFMN